MIYRKIIKTKKNEDGHITDIMLEDGRILPTNHAILMAKHGLLENTVVTRGKDGGEFLKTDIDSTNQSTLADLPRFKN